MRRLAPYALSNNRDWTLTLQRHAASVDERRSNVMALDQSVPPAGHLNCPASTKTRCDTKKSPTGKLSDVDSVSEVNSGSDGYLHEMEERIRSLQKELNEARASKRRRVQSDSDADPEHVQHSDESDSEMQSPRDEPILAPYEAETNGGDRDEGSYTLKTPKGAMRFFGKYLLTDDRFAMVTRTTKLILSITPRRFFSFFHCFP